MVLMEWRNIFSGNEKIPQNLPVINYRKCLAFFEQ